MFKILHVLSIAVLFIGCASSYNRMDPIKHSIYNGNYQKALDIYDSLGIKEENAISLDHANRGLLLHFAREYTESNFELELAELYMDRLLKENLSQIISSFIINEYSLPYNGEDYENVMVNFYKAFNYLLLDEPEEALVECRRIDYKLNLLYDLYSESTTYHEDAFARYLAGIIYEHLRYYDDALLNILKLTKYIKIPIQKITELKYLKI